MRKRAGHKHPGNLHDFKAMGELVFWDHVVPSSSNWCLICKTKVMCSVTFVFLVEAQHPYKEELSTH